MRDIFLAEVDEKYAKGILVRELPNAVDYPLRGLSHPLKSGMNSDLDLKNYFRWRTSLKSWEASVLEKYHPEFYRKLLKEMNPPKKKSFLERIFGF